MSKTVRLKLFLGLISLFLTNWHSLYGQNRALIITENYYQDSLYDWQNIDSFLSFQKELPADFNPTTTTFPNNWNKFLTNITLEWTDNIWLQLPIINQTDNKKELTLLLHADLLDVWYINDNQVWQHHQGGNLMPRSDWDSQKHQPVYSSPHTIQFSISAQKSTTLFIKVGSIDSNVGLYPKLCNRRFFLAHSTHYFQRTIATQSFFHGILVLMFLFTLGMFLLNKDRAYLFYAIYTLSVSLFLGYAFEFQNFSFLAEFPRLGRILSNLGRYTFPFFYNLFLIHFLHAEGWRLDIKQRLQQFNLFLLTLGGLTTLCLIFFAPPSFKILYTNWLYLPVILVGIIGFVRISWQYWRSNNRLARFVAANNLFLLIGFMVSSLIFFLGGIGLIDIRSTSFWGILFLEATIVLQLLSFSLSLSYKGLETEKERVKLKELDRLKSRFFANISHEFRTPLTLILGPIQELKTKRTEPHEQKLLKITEKYAKNLLRLVNQILDLTKLEVGKMQLENTVFDWIAIGKVITYSFASAAQQKQIELQFNSPFSKLSVQLDQAKMEQILINLLANALKFTPEGGKIQVNSRLIKKDAILEITVKDNGVGISEEQQKYIFQHFYQADHGDFITNQPSSGIGLSLTQELINLHDGTIEVLSDRGKGTSFIIKIPLKTIDKQSLTVNSTAIKINTNQPILEDNNLEKIPSNNSTAPQKPLILLVEDHPDIQTYIQSCLAENYQLVVANNGELGVKMATEQVPDLIITDVMMPKKDGFTLTKELKNNAATSHIPIIILTGKSSKDSKMEGLSVSADDYLTKPFDAAELRLRVKNLLDNRQKWVQHFQQTATTPLPDLAIPSIEDVFIQKALKAVENNLGNEDFSVEKLGKAVHLDRTQLFRKLKAITGQNPSNFIRTVRLKKAYTLLQSRSATVGEVAFSVGFSSTTYFNRCFKEQFGKTPGAVLNPNKIS